MKTDSLFYRLFQELPDCFFPLVGWPETDAARHRFESIELKDTAVRLDGLYLPNPPDDRQPAYFIGFQSHRSERVYSNLLLKVALYLEKVNPRQNWHAVVVYLTRSMEHENLYPYRTWLDSEQLTRYYVDEITNQASIGLTILRMMSSGPNESLIIGKLLVPHVKSVMKNEEKRRNVIELIATVIAYQFPKMNREEIEKMLQVDSFRETRVYQEAFEEGEEKGIEKGIEKGKQLGETEAKESIARKMLAKKCLPQEIVEFTGLSLPQIKKLKKKPSR